MFTIDTTITDLKVREKNILKILFSMNIHQVATPEMMLEDARSYVLFFRESKGKLFAHIALHLLTTNRKLYYSYSDNPFSDDQVDAVDEEALAFLEGLGAMIDEIDFTNMSDSAQDRWLNEQDIFSEKPVIAVQPAEPAAPEAAPEALRTAAPIQTEAPPAPEPVATPAAPIAAPPQPEPVAAPSAPIAVPPQPEPVATPAAPIAAPPQPQPIAAPVQAPPQPIPVPPPVTPYVQPVLTPVHAEPAVTPTLKPVVSTAKPAAPRVPMQQPKQQQKTSVKRQQEIMQQAVKANIVKSSVTPQSREAQPAPGVVSRDKEALARLLASF